MKLLATVREHDIFPDRPAVADDSYDHTRRAVRMILVDRDGLVAAIFYPAMTHIVDGVAHESKEGYMLPGGGVDAGEELRDALVREAYEETGCELEQISELGMIQEYGVGRTKKHAQEEYFYFARVKGEKGLPKPTEQEMDWKAEVRWLPFNELEQHFRDRQSSFMAHIALIGMKAAESLR